MAMNTCSRCGEDKHVARVCPNCGAEMERQTKKKPMPKKGKKGC